MLWQSNTPLSPQSNEGTQLPATFDETFDTAWRAGLLYTSGIVQSNARVAALDNYVDEVRRTTGQDIAAAAGSDLQFPQLRMDAARNAVSRLKQDRPDLQIPDLTDDELDRRAASIAGLSHEAFAEMSAREKTFGGKLGMLAGGLLAGAGDPINLIYAPVPEAKLGIVATAALWSGFGAGSAAVNEISNAQFRERATPGYAASGEPMANIAEAAAGGAVLGGLFKGVGAVWSRMKTGEWPRSVRDAGNIVESEANIQASNVLPGVEGEAAHREALGKAIDDIAAGKPVEVPERVGGLMDESARIGQPVSLLPTEAKPAEGLDKGPDLGGPVPSLAKLAVEPGAVANQLTPEAIQRTLGDPAHSTGLMADLERLRDTGGKPQMIPIGTDAAGEPQYQLLDAAIQEAKDYEHAASQIESCINPPAEEP